MKGASGKKKSEKQTRKRDTRGKSRRKMVKKTKKKHHQQKGKRRLGRQMESVANLKESRKGQSKKTGTAIGL